jgi:putative transposase
MNPKIPKKIRLDSSLYCSPDRVYSITIVANFKRKYFLEHDFNIEIIECPKLERERCGCRVFVYCLMPYHLHFLANPNSEEKSVINFVDQFKGKSTTIGWKYEIKGSLWQKRWYDHILRKEEDLAKSCEYISNNSVRKGLVKDWHEYPYCGCLDKFEI